MVGQLNGTFEAKEKSMVLYKDVTVGLLGNIAAYEVQHMPRTENKEVDVFSKLALEGMPDHISQMCRVEEVERTSTEALAVCPVDVGQQPVGPNWIEILKNFIQACHLPTDQKEAAKVKRQAPSFEIVDGHLYKRSFGGLLLKCLLPRQAKEVMDEVHKGVY